MDDSLRQLIEIWKRLIQNELDSLAPQILEVHPLKNIFKEVKSYHPLRNYNDIGADLILSFEKILSCTNSHVLSLYHKHALLYFMEVALEKTVTDQYFPSKINRLFEEWYKRIISEFASNSDTYYSHENDSYLKDFSVCVQKMIPIGGAWVVEISGISKKFLLRLSFPQWLANLYFFIKLKGFQPFYQIHTVINRTDRFNEMEREKAYYHISQLLVKNVHMKGMFASSWLYDPQLGRISPRLAYLVKTPKENGAKFFWVGPSQAATNGALMKSQTRRKLYAQGKYLPTAYIKIWHRNDLMNWVREHF